MSDLWLSTCVQRLGVAGFLKVPLGERSTILETPSSQAPNPDRKDLVGTILERLSPLHLRGRGLPR